jgi:hypothetical protein
MTKERKLEIKQEAQNRLNQWLENSTVDEMTIGGSRLRFDMSLGLFGGYPFEKESWMIGFDGFVNEDEFNSDDYNEIIIELFKEQGYVTIFSSNWENI